MIYSITITDEEVNSVERKYKESFFADGDIAYIGIEAVEMQREIKKAREDKQKF